MRSERGQGTVEYVGLVLLVAVLIGAVAGGLGLPQLTAGIASSITRAVLGATGITGSAQEATYSRPSAADRAEFARASDSALAPDDRPSLRDVRLALMRRHGDDRGRAIYRQLIIDDLRNAVPGLAGPTLFASATPGLRQPGVMERYLPINSDLSLVAPSSSDDGEVETPVTQPNAHVVTVSEADAALDHALHPGTSLTGVALDIASVAPLGRLAGGLFKIVKTSARVAKGLRAVAKGGRAVVNGVTLAEDAVRLEAPDASASPPGSREGDEIVTWLASRCPVHGGTAREFMRTAVVRDGAVILEGIRWPPGGPPPWHPGSPTDEGCS
jgi:hypothetical protein